MNKNIIQELSEQNLSKEEITFYFKNHKNVLSFIKKCQKEKITIDAIEGFFEQWKPSGNIYVRKTFLATFDGSFQEKLEDFIIENELSKNINHKINYSIQKIFEHFLKTLNQKIGFNNNYNVRIFYSPWGFDDTNELCRWFYFNLKKDEEKIIEINKLALKKASKNKEKVQKLSRKIEKQLGFML